MKVAIIGLDGATFDLIDPWIREEKLPNLKKLIKKGVRGKLRSVIPPISSAAWVSFATGKNPGKHGVFDFVIRSDRSYFEDVPRDGRLVSSRFVKDDTLWDILSKHGFKVGVVNVPVTYPPKKVNGFMISCFMTPPGAEFTYPPDLKNLIPYYKIDVDFVRMFFTNPRDRVLDKDKFVKEQFEVTRLRARAVKELLEKYKLDFFIVVFKGTDNLQHFFWTDKNLLKKYYIEIDGIIGDLLKLFDDANVFIVSDHGFGPDAEKRFHINNWLEQMGYLRVKRSIKSVVFRVIQKCGSYLVSRLRASIPMNVRQSIERRAEVSIDWSKTLAFGSKVVPGIRINLKDREPYGIVDRKDYEKLRDEIILKLYKLKDNGIDVIKEVYRREEIYSGKYLEEIPDIVILTNPRYKYTYHFGNSIFSEYKSKFYKGDHVNGYIEGLFIAYGPDIKESIEINAMIYDIAPTVLHIFGLPIPTDMDGRVLKEIFKEDSDPGKRDVVYYDKEKVKIKKMVKRLK